MNEEERDWYGYQHFMHQRLEEEKKEKEKLQQENNKLKKEKEDLQERIDKAIHCIEKYSSGIITDEDIVYAVPSGNVLEILKGSDK